MKPIKLAIYLVTAVSIISCQNLSMDVKKDAWQGKRVTPVMLTFASSTAANGSKILYGLTKNTSESMIKLTFNNPTATPIDLLSLTLFGGDENQCIIQVKGNYQFSSNQTTTFDVTDFTTFEQCVLGLNVKSPDGYQIAISQNSQYSGGANSSTSNIPFGMVIEYKQGQTKSVNNFVGFTHYIKRY